MPEQISQVADSIIVSQLDGRAGELLDAHIEKAKPWYAYEMVPWSVGRDFEPGETWNPGEADLPEAVQSALLVNLLTEDNLPYYATTILGRFAASEAITEWSRRWIAEENRHSTVIRDWVHVTRSLDPRLLEDGRMAQMIGGKTPQPVTAVETMAYVSFQELATQVAHRNTGVLLGKGSAGHKIMNRVAGDEKLHYEFYSGLTGAALEIDPTTTLKAIAFQLTNFKMPGTGIPDFKKHSELISDAKIYSFRRFRDEVVIPTLGKWSIFELEGLDGDAEIAREEIAGVVEALELFADDAETRAAERAAAKQ